MPILVDRDPGSHQRGIQTPPMPIFVDPDPDPGSHQAGSRQLPMPIYVDPDPGSHQCGIQGATNAYLCESR
jgi:hypothetical protein